MLNSSTIQKPTIATARITIRGLQEKKSKTFTVYGGSVDSTIEQALAAFDGRAKEKPPRRRGS